MPKYWWTLKELAERVGQHLGYSEWHRISQHHIDSFAESTGDRQWLHTVSEFAAKGPYSVPIAHGFLLVSWTPTLYEELFRLTDVEMSLNYRVERIRFRAPAPVGASVRAGFELTSVRPRPRGWTEVTLKVQVHVSHDASDETATPACILEQSWLYQQADRVYTLEELMPAGWPVTAMPDPTPARA